MVNLVKHDLQFILKQIKIAEAHAAGADLATLVAEAGGIDANATQGVSLQPHLLPYGLRTVDGSYNNLIDGREQWGASGQPFVPIATPVYGDDGDSDSLMFGTPANPVWLTNTNYTPGAATGNPMLPPGTVVDADPRLISNLIVDQTSNNPAAIMVYEAMLAEGKTATRTQMLDEDGTPVVHLQDVRGGNGAVLAAAGSPVYIYTFENVSPDIGDSAPYNSMFTLFGQFFDHGLDLVAKGGAGTVYIPLSPDDPLYNPASPHTNFMVLTRAKRDADGEVEANVTTPWVDQNQTYTSHASHQVFLREYTLHEDKPVATGHLLDGARGLATWADVKQQARTHLGIELTDADVTSVPLLRTDPYGNFIPDPVTGFAQLIVGVGADGVPNTGDDIVISGTPDAPVNPSASVAIAGITYAGALRIPNAFLDDIAHAAAPVVTGGVLQTDADDAVGYSGGFNSRGQQTAYDDELLDAHYITGDGRGNENVGLTAIHHVFHSEHNNVVEQVKSVVLASGDLAFINEWLLVDLPAGTNLNFADDASVEAFASTLVWDGERLFQAGRFTTEMEYQHLVFEEFARKMQPDVDAFLFEPSADVNPVIFAEFAHAVYRFGHSMLNQDIERIVEGPDGSFSYDNISLFDGFLNPLALGAVDADGNVVVDHEAAAGAIIRGMSRQGGNEVDEFVTNVLRNQLVGIPLDLAAINIARGRDVGLPTLNEARAQFYQITGQDSQLKPYTSWVDFALNIMNPASIVNFIAAYGTHSLIEAETSIEGKRAAAMAIVFGSPQIIYGDPSNPSDDRLAVVPTDRYDFLNSTGAWATAETGLNKIDLWIGGLAEKKMDFGSMLGSTFSFVFELQMENLQEADRFYYLSRVQGLNLLNELENNTLSEIIMRNTDLGDDGSTSLPGDIFSTPDFILEMDTSKQIGLDPTHDDPILNVLTPMVVRLDTDGDGDADVLIYNGGDHVVLGGTAEDDVITSGEGDDTIWGRAGNDRLEGGYGVDKIFGGEGDDIITNAGTDIGAADFLHGNEGNDVIHGGSGLSLIFGNEGSDFIVAGPDGKHVLGGLGNDFIVGGDGGDFLMGNEGDDWIEGGGRFDTLTGENSELFFNSTIIGHDILNGNGSDTDYDAESGDDIMFQNEGIQRSNGMAGFDWAIHKGDSNAANSDLGIPIFDTQEAFILRDRFDLVEGLSGWKLDDTLTGRANATNARAELQNTAAIPGPDSPIDSFSNALLQKNVALISGLAELVAHKVRVAVVDAQGNPVLDQNGDPELIVIDTANASDILLGGGGDDIIKGLAGDDVIDGDKWLNARIAFTQAGVTYTADSMTAKVYRQEDYVKGTVVQGAVAAFTGRSLDALMFSRTVNPGELYIVREIIDGNVAGDIDTAVYTDLRANYSFGLNADSSLYIDHSGFDEGAAPVDDDDAGEGAVPKPLSDGRDTIRGIEKLQFTGATPNTVDILNVIEGMASSDTLNGTNSDDLLVGKAGSDNLNGYGGNDILMGGTGNDTLNGGAGNDSYIFGLADGNDIINEPASGNAAAGGTDRIAIGAGTLAGLNAYEITSGGGNDNLVIGFNGQQITVTDHFDNASEAVEFINLDGAVYEGYAFDGDYAISADDSGDRQAANGINTLLAGTTGGDDIIGGDGDDLLFGHDGSDDLEGGAGDDLLVGGGGNDAMVGGLGADTMVGGSGDDVYSVEDADDMVVEAATGGIDTVQTTLDAYTLGANVENLAYTGAATFTGTGNELANRIEGGGGVDTLSGLGGNDIYVVTAGDIILEAAAGGTDTVQSSATYTLGANLEILTLTGNGAINGTGNDVANTITGNNAGNQLFGAGGDDILNGNGGNDLLDGGTGNDTLNGGTGDNILIGGAGSDTVNLQAGNGNDDVIRYTASGFGDDVINGFDANPTLGQDRIDLSGLGITSLNFNSRVSFTESFGDTLVTVLNADGSTAGTIRIDNVLFGNGATQISVSDFILATPPGSTIDGTPGNNALNGGNNSDAINGLAGNDTLNGNGGNDVLTGGTGSDIVNGGDGDDTIIWNANTSGATDGRDVVDGGAEGTAGDTFVLNGNAGAETYRIYTRAAFDAVQGNSLAGINAATEIIVTRNGTNSTSIIAELRDIEEIRINGFDPAGASGSGGNDTFLIIGDFSATSLRPNTITVDGSTGDDTIDISSLGSAHRIVFKSNGGNDTIIGTLRPQDVVELPDGMSQDDYTIETDDDGVTTMTNGDHSIRFLSPDGLPQIGDGEDDDEEEQDDDDHEDGACGSHDSDDNASTPIIVPAAAIAGTAGADALVGTANANTIMGLGGRDVIFGHDGDDDILGDAGADMLYGDGGDDRILAGDGDDFIEGGEGNDTVYGGNGNDMIVARSGDGNDTYYGDDMVGGTGSDTLDMSAITANITADLGTGFMDRGSVSSAQTGNDVVWSVENFVGGFGNDTVTASGAVNVMDGGAGGNDTFRFLSAAHADGDTIVGFQPGDKIDLSAMDANGCATGKQSFTLVSDGFSGRGELMITHEMRDGEDYTVVQGNTTGGADADFKLSIKGSHELSASDFNL